jgi:uncharacterized coiled-coil protein SlyX
MSGIERVKERIAQIKREAGSGGRAPEAASEKADAAPEAQIEFVAPVTEVELATHVAAEVEKRVNPLEIQIPEVIEAIMAHITALNQRIDQQRDQLALVSKRLAAVEACLAKKR